MFTSLNNNINALPLNCSWISLLYKVVKLDILNISSCVDGRFSKIQSYNPEVIVLYLGSSYICDRIWEKGSYACIRNITLQVIEQMYTHISSMIGKAMNKISKLWFNHRWSYNLS